MGDRVRDTGTPRVWAIVRRNRVPGPGPEGAVGRERPGPQGAAHKPPDDDAVLAVVAAFVKAVPNPCPRWGGLRRFAVVINIGRLWYVGGVKCRWPPPFAGGRAGGRKILPFRSSGGLLPRAEPPRGTRPVARAWIHTSPCVNRAGGWSAFCCQTAGLQARPGAKDMRPHSLAAWSVHALAVP